MVRGGEIHEILRVNFVRRRVCAYASGRPLPSDDGGVDGVVVTLHASCVQPH